MKKTSFLILGPAFIFLASFCTADSSKEKTTTQTTTATTSVVAETTKVSEPISPKATEATKATEETPAKVAASAPAKATETTEVSTTALQMSAGEKLINKSDCIGCHNKVNKIIGPAYMDIAKKYPATEKNINTLADKIIKGGTGVWGSMPMTAHATLKKEDAKLMVRYILSLKKK